MSDGQGIRRVHCVDHVNLLAGEGVFLAQEIAIQDLLDGLVVTRLAVQEPLRVSVRAGEHVSCAVCLDEYAVILAREGQLTVR
jgi:hypothetical protein